MSRPACRTLLLFGAMAILAAGCCSAAAADVFGPISLASESSGEQALYARDPAISGDGRYVAFDGYFAGQTGVFRRDLVTGAVEPVAVGAPGTSAGSAELPSISEDGRFVSFTTTARLDEENDTNPGPDVYVRDMDKPSSEPCPSNWEESQASREECAFELVSALNGSRQGLSYQTSQDTFYGSVATGRSAMSADGQSVVFVTTAVSDLMPEAPGAPRTTETPAMQVVVRDLRTQETKLVSVRADPSTGAPVSNAQGEPEPVSGEEAGVALGAVYGSVRGDAPLFEPPNADQLTSAVGASISADGSTVAWMGDDLPQQTKLLSSEQSAKDIYNEPLWRRIAEGPGARTRLVTGGSDPENPMCGASGESSLPEPLSLSDPCQGPFWLDFGEETPGIWKGGQPDDFVPRLSGDGYTVAFLAQAPVATAFGTIAGHVQNGDLFAANMHPGLTRDEALRRLTEIASGVSGDLATTAAIVDLGISPDGSQVAFTTDRTAFPLGSPAYVSAPDVVPGMLELFDVDLNDDTLTRVTGGYEGGAGEHPHEEAQAGKDPYPPFDGALSPSFSDDGTTLAFSSTASNLVYSDGNSPTRSENGKFEGGEFDGSDAFVVSRITFSPTSTQQLIGNPPPGPALKPAWRLGVSALSRRDGSVLLEVEVPGAGTLRAGAQSSLAVGSARARKGSAAHRRAHLSVVSRGVASAAKKTNASEGGLLILTLRLAAPYRALANRKNGLSSALTVSFSAPHKPTLRRRLEISFHDLVKHPKKRSRT
jgi:hypothetical protein